MSFRRAMRRGCESFLRPIALERDGAIVDVLCQCLSPHSSCFRIVRMPKTSPNGFMEVLVKAH